MPHGQVLEGYRRMVFNVLAVNRDDHVKNLSFHMDPEGTWCLTPAYDVTFAPGGGWTASHQMRVNDKRAGLTQADLLAVAEVFGIRAPDRVVDEIAEVVAAWPSFAAERGVPTDTVERVEEALMIRAGEIG